MGVFYRQEVPVSFIDIGVGQVLLTCAILFVAFATTLSVANWLSEWTPSQRRRFVALMLYLSIVGFALSLWTPQGLSKKWSSLGTAVGAIVAYMLLYGLAGGEKSFLRRFFFESLEVFRSPTLPSLIHFGIVVLFVGSATAYIGYKGTSLETRDQTIVERECGPVSRVIRKYGELLVVQEPSLIGQPRLTRLVPPDLYKGWAFRDMPILEIEFRNSEFVGPCPKNGG